MTSEKFAPPAEEARRLVLVGHPVLLLLPALSGGLLAIVLGALPELYLPIGIFILLGLFSFFGGSILLVAGSFGVADEEGIRFGFWRRRKELRWHEVNYVQIRYRGWQLYNLEFFQKAASGSKRDYSGGFITGHSRKKLLKLAEECLGFRGEDWKCVPTPSYEPRNTKCFRRINSLINQDERGSDGFDATS